MKKAKRYLSLIMALAMILVLVACGSNQTPSSDDNVSSSTSVSQLEGTVPGSVVNFCMASDVGNYLPTTTVSLTSGIIVDNIFEGLLWDPEGYLDEPEPCLAESYEVSPDGLTYTFHIRQGVKFTNGETLTSADVAYSWDVRKEVNAAEFAGMTWECPDENTFIIHLESPRATLLDEICEIYMSVCSKKAYEEFGTTDDRAAIGTGPYYVDEYVAGSYMILKANPDYWNKDYVPAVETINCEIITDTNTAFIALQSGDIDILTHVDAIQRTMLENNDDYTLYSYADTCVDTVFFNTSCAPFNDIEVRKAFCYLINKEDVVTAAFEGSGVATYCPWSSESGLYTDNETLSQYYTYDVEKGLQILKDAGYEPSDISFEILAPSSSTQQVTAVENIQAQLMALGMDVKVTTYDRPTYMSYIRDKDYQCAIHDIGAVLDTNNAFSNCFLSDGLNHFNNYGDSDSDFQAYLDNAWYEASACITREEQDAVLKEALEAVIAHYSCFPIVEKSIYIAVNSDLEGLIVSSSVSTRFDGLYWTDTE